MRKISITTFALAFLGLAGSAGAQTVVTSDITTNTTWGGGANPSPIVLDVPIFVKDGATLTILPGTIVRGQPRSGAVVPGSVVGTPGTLIVTRTGRIVANGSASNPIIFTTAAVDNNMDGAPDPAADPQFDKKWLPGDRFLDDAPASSVLAPLNANGDTTGLWGGLVVLGNAPTNNTDKAGLEYGTSTVEGLTVPGFPPENAAYGGVNPQDNSGSLRFVSIRHAGDEIGADNELNGLTLGAVGSGTTVEFVDVYANFDDGVEWFGGTVNGRNLSVAYVGDDAFDVDEGYTGVNQFLFSVAPYFRAQAGNYGSANGDKICECDGDNMNPDRVILLNDVNVRLNVEQTVTDPTPWPLSYPAFYNWTGIGSTLDAAFPLPAGVTAAGTKRGLQFRNGFAGEVHNTIVVNTGGETGFEVDTSASGAPGFDAIDNANNGLIAVVCSTFADGAALAAQELTVSATGNALNTQLLGSALGVNRFPAAGTYNLLNEDIRFKDAGNVATAAALTGNALGKIIPRPSGSRINPRPASGINGIGCVGPQGTGLDSSVTFRGAFSPSAGSQLWTTGWTSMSIAGMLEN